MRVLITGGTGFVGCNLAHAQLSKGREVVLFDSLSRPGTENNLYWLRETFGDAVRLVRGDIRNAEQVKAAAADADVIFHLAAQVAVTTSVAQPRHDFEVNALGTLNVLEAARLSPKQPMVLYTSTNKVYGKMDDMAVAENGDCYAYRDLPQGIAESEPLDFYSPYGCSKGCADQYVRDYARIYGLRTVVFRMSCIYGPRQFGNEDQGWIAHFIIASVLNHPLTIYGDGKQVRDVLYVDDLTRAMDAAVERIERTGGQVYNMGGGADNALSLLQLIDMLQSLQGKRIPCAFGDWRPGDQKVYVSDTRKAKRDFGWQPQVSKEEGVKRLYQWVVENPTLFQKT
jgi:CDP-paratose 2-epimerase